ncbi:ribosome small subunit-dependent GTPase A [Mycoplasma sp. ES3157-GEN-MYC]|uniref:Small ribosomal subunit biogenesis GTPase RsgA n=1 Tax=Mycoplasma miroungigenitalium TaxID=754515 RepID=A0A6M4J9I4_9MOLU|nr:ribosome small subunit-dependent GTPase A [Mycoplasma miroungigenitalium]MBU4690536.1 ribosome small subunit-dependent GTPase A [Mycoplasma miroungigenitalium]MBU4691803.1 ribosome small subunit-dependent GTPase A [Mycoplasma miroungigenitalium]QJR43664.1 ribosome small subunit-dependent GTPase A [Mycoplasma miroungigenitalium]
MQGKIYSLTGGRYHIKDTQGQMHFLPAAGVFRHKNIDPIVGDIVEFEPEGYITAVHERKNSFIRPKVANIDAIIVVMSVVEPTFQPYLVDKYLAFIEANDIEPIIFVTKIDLALSEWKTTYKSMGYTIYEIDYRSPSWLDDVKTIFKDRVISLMGQSGVGKTTFINAIAGTNFETQEISKFANRGKHTTRVVQIIDTLGGQLIDTPGFSSFDTNLTKLQLAQSFKQFKNLGKMCKFKSCLHLNEPDNYCNIKINVKQGVIPEFRYNNYLKMLKEAKDE